MKKIAISLIFPLFVGLFLTSCLPEEEKTELTSTVALLSFGINDLKTQHTITLENGKDSTYTTIMSASSIPFTIDQKKGLVYNNDSIAYGTDVTHVVTNLGADGYVHYYKNGEKVAYSTEDSIDFTHPVTFTITSYDGQFTRDYLISINVHKINPNKTYWERLDGSNFPAGLFTKQYAIIRYDRIYVFGQNQNNEGYTTSTAIGDGTQWDAPSPWDGISKEADCTSVILHNNTFYMLSNNTLYRSEDGIIWQVKDTNAVSCLLATTSEETSVVWGLMDNTFVYSTDMATWENNGQTILSGIDKRIAYFSHALRTNSTIHRTMVIGTSSYPSDTCAHIWNKLSTEQEWTEVTPSETNIYRCPNLENLAVVRWHNKYYAFGGRSIGQRDVPIEAFSAFYESRDNGVTWRKHENGLDMHPDFAGSDDTFSTIIDDKQRIWIMWSTSGEVWRATWNSNN